MKSTIAFWGCLITSNLYAVAGNSTLDTVFGIVFLVLTGINFYLSIKE